MLPPVEHQRTGIPGRCSVPLAVDEDVGGRRVDAVKLARGKIAQSGIVPPPHNFIERPVVRIGGALADAYETRSKFTIKTGLSHDLSAGKHADSYRKNSGSAYGHNLVGYS